jgi:hypothetical protein
VATVGRLATVVAVLSAAGATGCYGSTEPASDVTGDTAKLHARGTANSGPARSYFEFWPTNGVQHRYTYTLRWPAAASGPFSQDVRELEANTEYSFRVCGSDEDKPDEVCANTRTFTTGPLTHDWVSASWFLSSAFYGGLYARGGPNGENPTGTVRTASECGINPPCIMFEGSVSCLAVSGNRAAVGAVGEETSFAEPDPEPTPATRLVTVVDVDDANGTDRISYVRASGSTPPNCAAATLTNPFEGGATVRDATSAPAR